MPEPPPPPGEAAAAERRAWIGEAVGLYEANGVVCFPSLVPPDTAAALAAHIAALETRTDLTDNSAGKRFSAHEASRRVNKAVPVADAAAQATINATVGALAPFFRAILRCCDPPVLESAFLLSLPGAPAQNYHTDTSALEPHVAHLVKVQVVAEDIVPAMGPLEVKAGTQRGRPDPSTPEARLALPAGSVVVYNTRVQHRGGANARRRRPIYYFTLKGGGVIPTGIRYAIQPGDIGAWRVSDFDVGAADADGVHRGDEAVGVSCAAGGGADARSCA